MDKNPTKKSAKVVRNPIDKLKYMNKENVCSDQINQQVPSGMISPNQLQSNHTNGK